MGAFFPLPHFFAVFFFSVLSYSLLVYDILIKHNVYDKNISNMKNNSFARFAPGFFICAHFEFAAVLMLYAILDGKANLKVFFKKH